MMTMTNTRAAWRRLSLAALLGVGLAGPVAAQDAGLSALRPLVGMGLTFGGDTLATVFFDDGDDQDIKAGQLVQFYVGAVYQAVPQFSVQATLGYHVDKSSGENASLRFARYPLELLGHYHIDDKWSFGGGVRFVSKPKVAGSGDLSGLGGEFDDTTGVVVEGEYRIAPQLGLKLRYVSEEYKAAGVAEAADGSHVGFFATWYF
jgi:hypothetical protein